MDAAGSRSQKSERQEMRRLTEKKKEEQEKRTGGRGPADFAEQIRRANESNPFMLHNHIRRFL